MQYDSTSARDCNASSDAVRVTRLCLETITLRNLIMPESLRPISNQVPSAMLESERHNEIAKILAGGLIRLQGLAPALQKSNAPSKRSLSQSKPPNNSVNFLTEDDLAHRWVCSTSRLQRWRSQGDGPAYLKIGRKILYRLQDIQVFEQSCQSARNASFA